VVCNIKQANGALQKSVDDSSKSLNLPASQFLNDSNDRNSAMNSKFLIAGLVLSALISSGARASTISVDNASFETLPPGGLDQTNCSPGCSFSVGAIPGWNVTGTSGQFNPGTPGPANAYFNSVPDGFTVAYTNSGTITQTVLTTAVAGITYILQVDLGLRKDAPNPGFADLIVNGNTILATGAPLTTGDWTPYTATYTATAADSGKSIEILLGSLSPQGDFDNVVLSAVPEVSTWCMLLIGFAGIGFAAYRRKNNMAFRFA
jgi:hypothetical protein